MNTSILPRLALALAALTSAGAALADGDRAPRVAPIPAYTQECGACHLAYPPGLLPAASWQRLMTNLPRHFGTDASLDTTTTAALSAWLAANAGTRKKASVEPPQDRISLAPWFVREHREVSAADWKRPAIKSAANCAACHTQAAQGDFSERQIRIPR